MKNIVKKIAKYRKYIFCLVIVILSILSIVFQNIDRKNSIKINDNSIQQKDGKIAVYITGAVKNPGIYYLNQNARISDALDICGGILENADIDKINLAKKVIDSDKITVPVKQIEKENFDDDITNEKEQININTASKNELMTLNGIGEATAQKIIDYREKKSFNEIEDIMQVQGIGQSKFNKIKDNICTD